jgi:hypothetical protein
MWPVYGTEKSRAVHHGGSTQSGTERNVTGLRERAQSPDGCEPALARFPIGSCRLPNPAGCAAACNSRDAPTNGHRAYEFGSYFARSLEKDLAGRIRHVVALLLGRFVPLPRHVERASNEQQSLGHQHRRIYERASEHVAEEKQDAT